MKLIIFLLLFGLVAKSQIDSVLGLPLIGIHFGGQMPAADMAKRFGPNLEAGGMLAYKTNKNWIFGVESSYLFGKNVKEKVLTNLTNSDGFITDNEGFPADLRINERGFILAAFFGRVFGSWYASLARDANGCRRILVDCWVGIPVIVCLHSLWREATRDAKER